MSFTQPCFIKKNTPELRKKLEDIGHVRYPYEFADWDDDGKDRKYIIIDIMYYTYSTEPIGKPKKKDVDFVDCGDNEELFLALAALRFTFDRYYDDEKLKYRMGKKITIISSIIIFVFSIGTCFIPNTNEAYMIYGLGGTIDYIKSNEVAKQLPDKCIIALDKYLEDIANEQNH